MNRSLMGCISKVLAIVLTIAANLDVNAESIEQLLAANKLHIKVRLLDSPPLIIRQQLSFEVEVASAYSFADNISLEYLNIDNAVVLPLSPRTYKEQREIEGANWNIQRKLLLLHPLRSGNYTIPALKVRVSISSTTNSVNKAAVIEGTLTTEDYTFSVSLPNALSADDIFTVTPEMTVTLSHSPESEDTLSIGDAVTRSIHIIAESFPAIMLPKLTIQEQPGLRIYQKPAQADDKFSRKKKATQGHRKEEITYIFEQKGNYRLPELRYVWWDLKAGQRREIVFPERIITVGNGTATHQEEDASITSALDRTVPWLRWLTIGLIAIFIFTLLLQLYRYRKAQQSAPDNLKKTGQKQLRRQYLNSVTRQHYPYAIQQLYQLAESLLGTGQSLRQCLSDSPRQIVQLNKLQALAYGADCSDASCFTLTEARELLDALMPSRRKYFKFSPFEFSLHLNKG